MSRITTTTTTTLIHAQMHFHISSSSPLKRKDTHHPRSTNDVWVPEIENICIFILLSRVAFKVKLDMSFNALGTLFFFHCSIPSALALILFRALSSILSSHSPAHSYTLPSAFLSFRFSFPPRNIFLFSL